MELKATSKPGFTLLHYIEDVLYKHKRETLDVIRQLGDDVHKAMSGEAT